MSAQKKTEVTVVAKDALSSEIKRLNLFGMTDTMLQTCRKESNFLILLAKESNQSALDSFGRDVLGLNEYSTAKLRMKLLDDYGPSFVVFLVLLYMLLLNSYLELVHMLC